MSKLAPVLLFAYNRPIHFKKTLNALAKNQLASKTNLHVFLDGAKKGSDLEKIETIQELIKKETKNFKKVELHQNKNNKGLANSIIDGVSKIIKKSKKVIVLEDDLISHPYFLNYMNQMLNYYEKKEKIWAVSGFNFPKEILNIDKNYKYNTFFSLRPSSWGWGTWLNRWQSIDWTVSDFKDFAKNEKLKSEFNKGGEDLVYMLKMQMRGEIDSWAIRFTYQAFKEKKYTIYPVKSLINNIGLDGSGEHSSKKKQIYNNLNYQISRFKKHSSIILEKSIINNFKDIYKTNNLQKLKGSLKRKIKKLIK